MCWWDEPLSSNSIMKIYLLSINQNKLSRSSKNIGIKEYLAV